MIEANKYLDLDLSILNISSKIIKDLQENDVRKYDELLKSLQNELSENVKNVYTASLSFLFLLDKIEYFEDIDAFSLKDETK